MNTKTHVTQIALNPRFQERLGRKVKSAVAGPTQCFLLAVATVCIFLLAGFALSQFPPPPYLAGFFSISSFMGVVLIVSFILVAWLASRDGRLRYRATPGLTWVSQAPFFGPLVVLGTAIIIVALGIYSICFVAVGVIQNSGNIWGAAPRSAWLLGAISIALSIFAGREVSRVFRANIGVRLAPDRVGLNHEHRDLFLYWNQIAHVTVEAVNRGTGRKKRPVSCVRIEVEDGRVFYVDIAELGSDPNVVAALMCYYLDRPQERHLLADPEAAIRRFSEAQAEQ